LIKEFVKFQDLTVKVVSIGLEILVADASNTIYELKIHPSITDLVSEKSIKVDQVLKIRKPTINHECEVIFII
jgi:hypothetical protein